MVLHVLFAIVGNKFPHACKLVCLISCFQIVKAQTMEHQAQEAMATVKAVKAMATVHQMKNMVPLLIYSVLSLI